MTPEARAVVDLVPGGTPVCNADMDDLHPDMSSAAAEIYASSIVLAEFLHITYMNEEMGFGKIKPVNILVDNSTAIVLAKCMTKRSKLQHVDCRQRWAQALWDCTICDLVKVGTDNNLPNIFTKILGPNKFESLHDHMMVACSTVCHCLRSLKLRHLQHRLTAGTRERRPSADWHDLVVDEAV